MKEVYEEAKKNYWFFADFSLIVSALIQMTCHTLGNRRLTLDKYNSLVAED